MKKCKLCGKDYEVGVKDCCSDECFKEDIQKRAKIATEDDVSHTKKYHEIILSYSIFDIS